MSTLIRAESSGIAFELTCTNYAHPSITTGQHTNGPCVWWYRVLGEHEWVNSGEKSLHKVRAMLEGVK